MHDALADMASANELLTPFLDRPLRARELSAVRAVQAAVVPIVDALIDGCAPPLEELMNWRRVSASSTHSSEKRTDPCGWRCGQDAPGAPRRCWLG